MPCWEVRNMSVEFRAENLELLKRALDAVGLAYSVNDQTVTAGRIVLDLAAGKATFPSYAQATVNKLKQAYSVEAVKAAAKAKGWSVKAQSPTKMQIVRW